MDDAERIRRLSDELARSERELLVARARLEQLEASRAVRLYRRLRRLPDVAPPHAAIDEADPFEAHVTWIFGTGRSGSTWFMRLLAEHEDVVPMHEPWIGHHLAPFTLWMHHPEIGGDFFEWMRSTFRDDPDYFFAAEFSDVWRPRLRELLLERLHAHVRHAYPLRDPRDIRMVAREPNASWAAETIMSLVPRSRMIFLVRDGRDVLDSLVDGYQEGGWLSEDASRITVTPENRLYFIESHASAWVDTISAVQRAYDAHRPEDRLLVKYEELLADTPRVLRGVFEWLGTSATDTDAIAAKHAFGARDETGSGRPQRAASPGLWRENFSAEERSRVDRVMGAKLRELGYYG